MRLKEFLSVHEAVPGFRITMLFDDEHKVFLPEEFLKAIKDERAVLSSRNYPNATR